MGIRTLIEGLSDRLQSVSIHHLMAELRSVAPQGPPDIAAAFLPIWGETAPVDTFTRYCGTSYRLQQHKGDGVAIHQVTKTVRPVQGDERQASGAFASFPFPGGWLLAMTRDDWLAGKSFTDVIENCLTGFAEVFYPSVVTLTPSASGLRRFLGWLHDSASEMLILRSTLRFSQRGFQTTQRTESIGDTLDRLEEEGGFLHRVTYQVKDGGTGYTATVSRDGLSHFHDGDIAVFLSHFQELVNGAMADRALRWSDARSAQPGWLEAFDISFERAGLLAGIEDTERFVEVIESDPTFVVTVLHGNPYLHLSVIDVRDGSTFSIYSHHESTAQIIAGPSASNASLNRMIGRIRREFAELVWESSAVEP